MRQVLYNERQTLKLAENWNELSAEQLILIAPSLLQKEVSQPVQAWIAHVLLGIKNKAYNVKASRKKGGYDYYGGELVDRIVPEIQFLFGKCQLTAQLLPVINVRKRFQFFGTTELHGPAESFNNITIAEFSDTESCLTQYEITGDVLWLNRFIAVLYRPQKTKHEIKSPEFNGDMRQVYNFHLNDFIAVMVSKLSIGMKAAILLNYYGCRAEFVECNSFLFEKGKGKGEGTFTDVIHALAGPKFGTVDETGRVLLKVAAKELKLMKESNAQ